MSVAISLWSNQQGEIQKFLRSYYSKNVEIDKCSRQWMIDFSNPLDSIDIISALMDNVPYYDVVMYIHMDNGYLHKITKENCNDVIKGLLSIYYSPV
jgi:hypothetical protein